MYNSEGPSIDRVRQGLARMTGPFVDGGGDRGCRAQGVIAPSAVSLWMVAALAGALSAVDAGLSAAAAEAGTLQVVASETPAPRNRKYKRLEYRAAPGEANRLRLRFDGKMVVGVDQAGIDPGAGCERADEGGTTSVRCPFRASDVNRAILVVTVGDQDDTVDVHTDPDSRPLGGEFFGGAGDDVLRSDDGASDFRGGDGDDRLIGRSGIDFFYEGRRANGADIFVGGPRDFDTVIYSGRSRPVSVDFDGRGDDGERGEGDHVDPSIDGVEGGSGGDRLIGDADGDHFEGRGGADLIRGGGGADLLVGAFISRTLSGLDRSAGAQLGDRIFGEGGSDDVRGGGGDDRLGGGVGQDRVSGGGGDDELRVRDGGADSVLCSRGFDRVVADTRDFFRRVGTEDCEVFTRPQPVAALIPGEFEVYAPTTLYASQGFTAVAVACPADAPRVCRGRVLVTRRGRLLAAGSFARHQNKVADTFPNLTPLGRKSLRRFGRVRVTIVVVSRDRRGASRRQVASGSLEVQEDADGPVK